MNTNNQENDNLTEQTWLYCPSDKNISVDLNEFLHSWKVNNKRSPKFNKILKDCDNSREEPLFSVANRIKPEIHKISRQSDQKSIVRNRPRNSILVQDIHSQMFRDFSFDGIDTDMTLIEDIRVSFEKVDNTVDSINSSSKFESKVTDSIEEEEKGFTPVQMSTPLTKMSRNIAQKSHNNLQRADSSKKLLKTSGEIYDENMQEVRESLILPEAETIASDVLALAEKTFSIVDNETRQNSYHVLNSTFTTESVDQSNQKLMDALTIEPENSDVVNSTIHSRPSLPSNLCYRPHSSQIPKNINKLIVPEKKVSSLCNRMDKLSINESMDFTNLDNCDNKDYINSNCLKKDNLTETKATSKTSIVVNNLTNIDSRDKKTDKKIGSRLPMPIFRGSRPVKKTSDERND